MEKYIIIEDNGMDYHAGSKARNDIDKIALDYGYTPLKVRKYKVTGAVNRIRQFLVVLYDWVKICMEIKKGSNLLIQFPLTFGQRYVRLYLSLIKKIRKVNVTTLIHDIHSIRGKDKTTSLDEIRFLKNSDYIICHNDKMKNLLNEMTIENQRIISLDIFDYISDFYAKKDIRDLKKSIIIAGNLDENKSKYVYRLKELDNDLIFNLYGPNYKNMNQISNIIYHGQYQPEELLNKLEGSFGLVWDGNEINTCSGNYGEYLKINNPHKTSLYLAAGIPVIVWDQSAVADFVQKENIGICVSSLFDISESISNISQEEYILMLNNVSKISEKLKGGYYTKIALDKTINNK
ncbi:hypothetical protein ACFYKX_14180 [Cytobacillus sp. FJAT-54145]|uniref:Beta-1,6-galactofuranosyltransferase n=1 Tax=Cytobacillus spartinae TaxID=3299023 RepID=A0ABW6KC23_9BACI